MLENSEPLPAWATETPVDDASDYSLQMWIRNDEVVEHVETTRAEYILLKLYLANLRGYVLTPEQKDEDVTPREHAAMAISAGLAKFAGPQIVELGNAGRRLERLERLREEQGKSGQLDEQIETASREYGCRSAEIMKALDRLKAHG